MLLLRPEALKLEEDQKQTVLQDFAMARSCKVAHWEELPWALFGLGHYAVESARAAGRRSRELYSNEAGGNSGAQDHWL
eukprot:5667383-Amphidinium_carterae.1